MHRISGAGHVGNMFAAEDPATNRPPTEITAAWMNDVQEELVAAATQDGAPLGGSSRQLADVIGARVRHFITGMALPAVDIGPIWHADYNSIMTWQVFDANGAAYIGYASVLIGNLLMDTQPTARPGYIKSGIANLSRATYAALRNWAMHNGIMVAAEVWTAGAVAVKDNADGTTFTVYDVRGEYGRFWDDDRGVVSQEFGQWLPASLEPHTHLLASYYTYSGSNPDGGGLAWGSAAESGSPNNGAVTTNQNSGTETRPRGPAFLAAIKF